MVNPIEHFREVCINSVNLIAFTEGVINKNKRGKDKITGCDGITRSNAVLFISKEVLESRTNGIKDNSFKYLGNMR